MREGCHYYWVTLESSQQHQADVGAAPQGYMYLQNTNMSSTREECARLSAKLEVLEQRQGAAAHQISDAAHTQSVHAKQVDRCMEEHQHRLMVSVNKAECRGREAAEQIAQQAVSDARTSMQVMCCAALPASCCAGACARSIATLLNDELSGIEQKGCHTG